MARELSSENPDELERFDVPGIGPAVARSGSALYHALGAAAYWSNRYRELSRKRRSLALVIAVVAFGAGYATSALTADIRADIRAESER